MKQLSAIVLSVLLLASIALSQVLEPEDAQDYPAGGQPEYWDDPEKIPEHCDAILVAPACSIPEQIAQVRPWPSGCRCPDTVTAWDETCWLSGREASAAQQLGEVEPGVYHWRVWAEDCESMKKQKEFHAEAQNYVPILGTAKSLDISDAAKPVLKGGYSGRAPVAVVPTLEAIVEAQRIKEAELAAAAEMVVPVEPVESVEPIVPKPIITAPPTLPTKEIVP